MRITLLTLIFTFVTFLNCGGAQTGKENTNLVNAVNSPSRSLTPISDNSAERLAGIRMTAAKEGDRRAAEEYEQAISSGCKSAYAYYVYAMALNDSGQSDIAATQLRIVIEIEPKNWSAHWALARILIVDLKEFDAGLRELDISRNIDGLEDLGYSYDYYQGHALDGKGNLSEALRLYRSFEKFQSKVDKLDEQYKDVLKRIERIERLIRADQQK